MAKKETEMSIDNFTKQDNHLMTVMDNMIKNLTGANTFPHSNTIRVTGNGLREILPVIVGQVPVLKMRVYRVNPKNLRENKDVDVHMVMFGFSRLEHDARLGIGLSGRKS